MAPTPEQIEQLKAIKQKWIDNMTKQETLASVEDVIRRAYKKHHPSANLKEIKIFDDPILTLRAAAKRLDTSTKNIECLVSMWWGARAAWYEGGELLGAEYDKEVFELFRDFAARIPFCVSYEEFCYVSHKPVFVGYDEEENLHNESGPSVEWASGYKDWHIHGVLVDEQIVMSPETQTIKQIQEESNLEVRRVRIERFGWGRYITESNGQLLDRRRNYIDNTSEALFKTESGVVLVTQCPTGRMFSLEVPEGVSTCESAQKYLAGENWDGATVTNFPAPIPIGRS